MNAPGRSSAEHVCNVLVSKQARVISVNRPTDESYRPGPVPDHRSYEIWFEHECASEQAWRHSVLATAKEQKDAGSETG